MSEHITKPWRILRYRATLIDNSAIAFAADLLKVTTNGDLIAISNYGDNPDDYDRPPHITLAIAAGQWRSVATVAAAEPERKFFKHTETPIDR